MTKDNATYREHAAYCLEKVETAKDEAAKAYWRRMAEDWLKLAQSKEQPKKQE